MFLQTEMPSVYVADFTQFIFFGGLLAFDCNSSRSSLVASLPLQSPATVLQPTTLHRNPPQSCMLRMLPYSPVSSSLFSAAAHRNLSRATKPSPSFALPTVLWLDSSLVVLVIDVFVSSHKISNNNGGFSIIFRSSPSVFNSFQLGSKLLFAEMPS